MTDAAALPLAPALGGGLAAALAQADFHWLGAPVTRAEWMAALLGLGMVAFNLRVHPMGWVLAVASSILYALVFLDARLYGQVALQGLFIGMALWGWWQWVRPGQATRQPQPLARSAWRWVLMAWLLLWLLIGGVLQQATDSTLPYGDALPTAASLVATWLLARRHPENWLAWGVVNLLSVLLFMHQGLWPTVLLYGVMAALSWWGWRRWSALAAQAVAQQPVAQQPAAQQPAPRPAQEA